MHLIAPDRSTRTATVVHGHHRKVTVPGLALGDVGEFHLSDYHLLIFEQTSVPVAASADLPAVPQATCQLASKHMWLCAANVHMKKGQVIQASQLNVSRCLTAGVGLGFTHLQNMVAMLHLYQSTVHVLACMLGTIGNSYYSSFTLKPIASRNYNLVAVTVQDVSNVLQHGWQLLFQHTHSLLCLGVTNLWANRMQLKHCDVCRKQHFSDSRPAKNLPRVMLSAAV